MELVETKGVPVRMRGEKAEFAETWKCRGCERTVFFIVNRPKHAPDQGKSEQEAMENRNDDAMTCVLTTGPLAVTRGGGPSCRSGRVSGRRSRRNPNERLDCLS